MDDKLRSELSKIASLVRDPSSILPNLRPSRSREEPCPPKRSNTQSEPFKEIADEILKDNAEQSIKKKQCKPTNSFLQSEKSCKYRGMRGQEMRLRIQGDKVIDFCQEHGLIASSVTCFCGNIMRLGSKTVSDGCGWTCNSKMHKVRPYQTIRKGTWFENAKMTIAEILWIAYMWVHEYSTISMLHECDNSNKTVGEWCEHCLDLCQPILERKKDFLGGDGKSVEIFECKISIRGPTERWAFCAIEQYSTKSLHLIIDDKKSNTLFQIFEEYILCGTKVVTQNWHPLKSLLLKDFEYLTVTKSITFFDLSTKKNIETFEDFKKIINKLPLKHEKLVYGSAFCESVYRKSLAYAPDAYLAFLHDVSMIYKPVDKYVSSSTMDIGTAIVEDKEDKSL